MATNLLHSALQAIGEEHCDRVCALFTELCEVDEETLTEVKTKFMEEIAAEYPTTGKKKRGAKKPKPAGEKKPPTAYQLFMKEEIARIHAAEPEFKGNLFARVSEAWNAKKAKDVAA